MIAHPLEDAVLERDRIANGQQQFKRPLGFERFVRPVPMCAGRDAHGTDGAIRVTYQTKDVRPSCVHDFAINLIIQPMTHDCEITIFVCVSGAVMPIRQIDAQRARVSALLQHRFAHKHIQTKYTGVRINMAQAKTPHDYFFN